MNKPAKPATPLREIAEELGLPPRLLAGLTEAGVVDLDGLVHWYPRRWEDRSRFDQWPTSGDGEPVCLRARVTDQKNLRLGGRRHLLEITLEPPADADTTLMRPPLVARWFNLRWMSTRLPVGLELIVWGRPREHGGRLVLDHPEHEAIEGDNRAGKSLHLGRLVPIYPAPGAIQQRALRTAIGRALERLSSADLAPLAAPADFPDRLAALRALHFPNSETQQELARETLAIEEFIKLHLRVLARCRRHEKLRAPARAVGRDLCRQLLGALSFDPTAAQRRCLTEIETDLKAARPMTRLLQGDVGSGKTLVAAGAAALVIEAGWQVALLAPTQILAEQHFTTLSRWFKPLGVRTALHTAARRVESDNDPGPLFTGQSERAQLLVGTHALFEERVGIEHLGLVIVDEQHKFGVAQREHLLARGEAPDLLVMTATPIPRTLCLTHYGDLNISLLDELPANRGRVVTRVREPKTWKAATGFLRDKLAGGRQAYLVYPLVEDSEAVKAGSAEGELALWRQRLKGFEVGLLHGRLRADEKETIMERFRRGEIRVLVTTTVVEVGVDVPNATLMYVWNAERFGLAQLHQLRGRIGRSEHTGYCVLFSDSRKHAEAQEKLQVLAETADGFKLAEADLRLRGAGELLGRAQSGVTGELRLGDLVRDAGLVRRARSLAEDLLARDPDLESMPHLAPLLEPEEEDTLRRG